jgi:hypothetical protein
LNPTSTAIKKTPGLFAGQIVILPFITPFLIKLQNLLDAENDLAILSGCLWLCALFVRSASLGCNRVEQLIQRLSATSFA